MAEYLAKIFGTEEDRVNCAWYFKIGACRNGDQCNRLHNRPTMSQTLLLPHFYPPPQEALAIANGDPWDDDMYDRAQQNLEDFYIEVYLEFANYGEIEDMIVVDNLADHMIGNVYVKYYKEEDAENALTKLSGRFYRGRLINAEYSTCTNFREARCRAFHETGCRFGAYDSFMHIKHIPRAVKRRLVKQMYDDHPEYLDWWRKEQKRERKKREREQDMLPPALTLRDNPVSAEAPHDFGQWTQEDNRAYSEPLRTDSRKAEKYDDDRDHRWEREKTYGERRFSEYPGSDAFNGGARAERDRMPSPAKVDDDPYASDASQDMQRTDQDKGGRKKVRVRKRRTYDSERPLDDNLLVLQ